MRVSSRRLPCAAVAVAMAMSLPASALAAHPTKGGRYTGDLAETGQRLAKHVVVKVANSGKTASVKLNCADTPAGSIKDFDIDSDGSFKATKGNHAWSFKGQFTSKSEINAKLSLKAVCDGKGGRLTLELTG